MSTRDLVAAIALLCGSAVHAGYVSLSPPAGYTSSGTARAYQRIAANAPQWLNATVRTNASLNVGGRSVTMPAVMRMAANAPRVAAAAAYLNPAMVLASAALAAYYLTDGFQIVDNEWWNSTPVRRFRWTYDGVNHDGDIGSVCFSYVDWRRSQNEANGPTGMTYSVAMVDGGGGCYVRKVKDGFTYWEPVPLVELPPSTEPYKVSQDAFEQLKGVEPLPDAVANALPVPLPVEAPTLNPDAEGNPRPLRIPTGDPVPVPDTNPQEYSKPVTDVTPSPTPTDPWRVDAQPKNITTSNPDPLPETSTVPSPSTGTGTGTGTTPDKVTPKEDPPLLCEVFPNILACATPELNTPESDPLETKDKQITLAPDSGWGAGSGACPAPRHIQGANVDFSFQPLCNGLGMLRPVLLAAAWLIAAAIMVGASRSSE
jgi:hypothetical protein